MPMIEVIKTPSLMKKGSNKVNRPSTERSKSRSENSESVRNFKEDEEDKLEPSRSFQDVFAGKYYEDLSPDLKEMVRKNHLKVPRRGIKSYQ